MVGSKIPAKPETALFRKILRVSRPDTIGGQGYRRVTLITPSHRLRKRSDRLTGRCQRRRRSGIVRGNRRGDDWPTIPPRDQNSRHRPRRKREYHGRHPLSDRSRCRTQPRKRPNPRRSRTNTDFSTGNNGRTHVPGAGVTAGGCVDIGTTTEVHVPVKSNETSPGIRLPGGTSATDCRGSPVRRTGGAATGRMSGEASRLRKACVITQQSYRKITEAAQCAYIIVG